MVHWFHYCINPGIHFFRSSLFQCTGTRITPLIDPRWREFDTIRCQPRSEGWQEVRRGPHPCFGNELYYGVYVRSYSPYPLTPGMDLFNHIYTISFLLSSISNSPLVYAPTVDMIIGLSSATFNSNLLSIFWMGSILLFMVYGTSLFILARSIFKQNLLSLLAMIIGLSVTETGSVPNLQVFFPSSFVMCIFPLCFFAIYSVLSKSHNSGPHFSWLYQSSLD